MTLPLIAASKFSTESAKPPPLLPSVLLSAVPPVAPLIAASKFSTESSMPPPDEESPSMVAPECEKFIISASFITQRSKHNNPYSNPFNELARNQQLT